jgi:hypothetical protein
MGTTQKALIVRTGPDGHQGLDRLNLELERGWRVAEVSPMGGAGGATSAPCIAALVVLERTDDRMGSTLAAQAVEGIEAAEEVVEDISDVVEGDAGPPDAPPSPPEPGSA